MDLPFQIMLCTHKTLKGTCHENVANGHPFWGHVNPSFYSFVSKQLGNIKFIQFGHGFSILFMF
jgi:hypothetical protein